MKHVIPASEIFETVDGIHSMIWGDEFCPSPFWSQEQWVEIINAIEMTKQVAIYRLNQRLAQDLIRTELKDIESKSNHGML